MVVKSEVKERAASRALSPHKTDLIEACLSRIAVNLYLCAIVAQRIVDT